MCGKKDLNTDDFVPDKECEILLGDLKTFGILRDGPKFRHRDFATVAYIIGGCKTDTDEIDLDLMHTKDKNDILFKFLFPKSALSNDGTDLLDRDAERSRLSRISSEGMVIFSHN